jgi:haloalkane dehalogenase
MHHSIPWLTAAAVAACHSSGTATLHRAEVLDSFIAFRDLGAGRPIVFLHGNPTSSYVWRKVLPALCEGHRCLAPDLIGMGRSGKPESAYRYADHARYLDAWFDAMALRDVVLVGYDWGGVLAIDWASRHADRVRGLVVFETILQPLHWADYPPQGAQLFRTLRTPGAGEKLVLEQNGFLARSLDNGVKTGLSEADRAEYAAPFPDARSRRPMLAWTRSLPIDGEPADVTAVVARNATWLASGAAPRTLLLTFDGTALSNAPAVVNWATRSVPELTRVALGAAGHHAPEDAPSAIASAIARWLDERASE